MEILFYYFIAAFSFTIMYTWRYSYEVMQSVVQTLVILDINYSEYKWSPSAFMITSTVISFFLMPLVAVNIFSASRFEVIKAMTSSILVDSFGLTEKK